MKEILIELTGDLKTDNRIHETVRNFIRLLEKKGKITDEIKQKKNKKICLSVNIPEEMFETSSELTESEKKMVEANKKSTIENLEDLVDLKVAMDKAAEKTYEENKLNLCELLKDCIGMKFYMPIMGEVILSKIEQDTLHFINEDQATELVEFEVNRKGVFKYAGENAEICVFPADNQSHDWSFFKPPWIPKRNERVWVRSGNVPWFGTYFVEMGESFNKAKFRCTVQNEKEMGLYDECVPFNEIPW